MRYTALAALVLALPPSAQQAGDSSPRKIPVLLISGANNHDWEWTHKSLKEMLEESGRFAVTVTLEPGKTLADADELAKYKAFVLDYNGPRWGEAADQNFMAAVRGGTGVTVVHAANNPFRGWKEYETMVALLWRKGTGHGRFHPFDVKVIDRDHPITRDMPDMIMHPDELYHRLVHMHDSEFRLLATAHSSKKSGGTGEDEPMVLVRMHGKGRIFHTPLGHVWSRRVPTRASHADFQFRHLIARGTEWAATGEVTLPGQPPNVLTAAERKAGFKLLFNGRNMSGWRGYKQEGPPARGWVVEAGCLKHKARGGGGDLITAEQFGDFDLRFEFKVAPRANSGVIYRVRETQQQTYMTGPEYQVLDDVGTKARPKHATAALYDMVPAKAEDKVLRPVGRFNSGRIVIHKGKLQHWLNGKLVVESPIAGDEWKEMIAKSKFKQWSEFGVHATGHIALQDHGNEVFYRSIRIKRLD